MDDKINEIDLYYVQILDIWQEFCSLHSDLYELTCQEYESLLSNDIDKLEEIIDLKDEIITRVGAVEKMRQSVIGEINSTISGDQKIGNVTGLLNFMNSFEVETGRNLLKRSNSLLIDIIENIQAQNKKNQLYINRAVHSLKDLREGLLGQKKGPGTYGADGSHSVNVK